MQKCVNTCVGVLIILFYAENIAYAKMFNAAGLYSQTPAVPPLELTYQCLVMMSQCSFQTVMDCATGSVVDTR